MFGYLQIMKFTQPYIFLLFLMLFSCQNDNEARLKEQKKEAKKAEAIFRTIENGWIFEIEPLEATVQEKINGWNEWRVFMNEIQQKPKSSIGAFQKKAEILSEKAANLQNNIPATFNKQPIKARITALITRVKTLDLYIHLAQIPDKKIVGIIGEINQEIFSIQTQMEEMIRRSQIPIEPGESDIIRMKDTARAVPDKLINKDILIPNPVGTP